LNKNQGAGILFYTDDSFLLLKKRKNSLWEVAGGKKRVNEKYYDAAQRETKEEIGFLPKFKKTGFQLVETEKHQFKIYFAKVDKKFSCKLSDEHTDYKWIKFNNSKNYEMHVKIKKAVEFLQKTISPGEPGDWFTIF
jgi:dATP pyrophosphohydrolase